MAEAESSSITPPSPSFLRTHYEGWKDFWAERFLFLDNYKRFIQGRDDPIPSWSQSDIDEFIASDPVHGPTLKAAREAGKISAAGAAIGAISTAAFAWKYSKSPHGAALSFGAGAIFGMTFGQEAASHWLQLYRLDPMAAQVKFLDWWESKKARVNPEGEECKLHSLYSRVE